MKVYTCREREREGARGRVSDASGVFESESKKKEREGGVSYGLVSDWCGWHGPSPCGSWPVK